MIPKRFDEAIEYFRLQAPWISGSSWLYMADLALKRGDVLSSASLLSMVDDIWTRMDRALEQGEPYSDFVRRMGSEWSRDWLSVTSPRLKLIYHNNIGNALMAGRVDQLSDPDVLEDRPYWLYDSIMDMRTSQICIDRDGMILPATDPWWGANTPLLHHNCRSSIISLDEEEALEQGGKSPSSRKRTIDPPAEGWGSTKSWEDWKPKGTDYHPALYREFTDWISGNDYAHTLKQWRERLIQSWGITEKTIDENSKG